MKRILGLAVMILSLALTLPSTVCSQSQAIEAEGVAALVPGSRDLSRDRALEDALRNAVEQATGAMVANETLVENYQLLSDKIYSRSRGYVQSYEVINEAEEDGLLRVTVRAVVREGRLRNDLEAIDLLMRQARKPRVMVLFESGGSKEIDAGRLAEGYVAEILLQKGFKLVDADVVRQNIGHDKIIGLLAGDQRVATTIGAKYGAEIMLVGTAQATSNKVTIGDLSINSNQAVITAKVIRADTGEVKLSETRQATKPHVNSLRGMQAALQEASAALASGLVDRIVNLFQEQIYNLTNVKVVLLGLESYGQLQEIVQLLTDNVRGVKEIYQRGYSMGTAEIEIELTGNTQSVATDLTSRTFGPYAFDIKEITHNQLQVAVKTASP